MKLEEKVIRDVINILDNLVYWDTYPKEYKEEIPDLIKALNMHIVSHRRELLPKRLSNEAYIMAKDTNYETFTKWWDAQV